MAKSTLTLTLTLTQRQLDALMHQLSLFDEYQYGEVADEHQERIYEIREQVRDQIES